MFVSQSKQGLMNSLIHWGGDMEIEEANSILKLMYGYVIRRANLNHLDHDGRESYAYFLYDVQGNLVKFMGNSSLPLDLYFKYLCEQIEKGW